MKFLTKNFLAIFTYGIAYIAVLVIGDAEPIQALFSAVLVWLMLLIPVSLIAGFIVSIFHCLINLFKTLNKHHQRPC
jgi:uncharacterized membrane protein